MNFMRTKYYLDDINRPDIDLGSYKKANVNDGGRIQLHSRSYFKSSIDYIDQKSIGDGQRPINEKVDRTYNKRRQPLLRVANSGSNQLRSSKVHISWSRAIFISRQKLYEACSEFGIVIQYYLGQKISKVKYSSYGFVRFKKLKSALRLLDLETFTHKNVIFLVNKIIERDHSKNKMMGDQPKPIKKKHPFIITQSQNGRLPSPINKEIKISPTPYNYILELSIQPLKNERLFNAVRESHLQKKNLRVNPRRASRGNQE